MPPRTFRWPPNASTQAHGRWTPRFARWRSLSSQRDGGRHDGPAVGWAVDPKLAIEDGETVVEPHEAASMRLGVADAVVGHVDVKRAALNPRVDLSALCTSVGMDRAIVDCS
jgi:hypothetical protein